MSRSEFKEGWESFKRFARLFSEAYEQYQKLVQNPIPEIDFETFWKITLFLGLNELRRMDVQQVLKLIKEGNV